MLKNIQKYLLLNYPLIWNIKLLPLLSIAILGNILLFLFGYVSTEVDFQKHQFYMGENYFLIYFSIVILMILFIIIWLVNYSKNNAFKSYYPTKANKLYLEWILIFVSVCSIFLFPYSFDRGSNLKIRSYASIEDVKKATNITSVIRILMPTEDTKLDYFIENPTDNSPYLDNSMSMKNPNHLNSTNYDPAIDSIFSNTQVSYNPQFPNFRQFSFLNYSNLYYANYEDRDEMIDNQSNKSAINYSTIRNWLVDWQVDSIKKLMSDYLALERKNGIVSNITLDEWFSKIYNPPTFEVNNSNLFTINSYYIDKNSFSINHLEGSYNRIERAYNDNGSTLFLWMISLSLGISMLIFSFRVTSGKSWLISMIFIGLLSLFFTLITTFLGIFSGFFDTFVIFNFLVVILFVVELIILANSKSKGKTAVLVNHIINLLPLIPMIILAIIVKSLPYGSLDDIENNIQIIVTANIVLTFITVYLLIQFQIIRWKGLPEE